MARPQSPDYDLKRDAILKAAARLFARRGFSGASLADVAAASGISKSLFYHYFPSKEALLEGVMADHLDALVDAARDLPATAPAATRLRHLTRAFLRLYVAAGDNQKVLLDELDSLSSSTRAAVVAKQRGIVAAVEGLIHEIAPQAGPRAPALAMLFFGMINWTHNWYRPDGPIAPEALADMAVDLFLDGLRT
jgi:AcrR family transcriptional regulator